MAATKTKTTTKTKSAQPTKEERPPLWKVWFVASRPHTLTASISPNIVAYHAGVALFERAASGDAHGHGHAHVPVPAFSSYEYGWLTLKWTAFCMLMQLGTNLHNDYADFVKGADNEKRVGQARATQKGWLTPFQTAAASGGTLLLGLLLGLGFVADLATGQSQSALPLPLPLPLPLRVWGMLLMVLSSIFNAFAYTGGPWPLGYIGMPNLSTGYSGLGDACVFLYFGLLATLMPPWLYTACHSGTNNNYNNNSNNSSVVDVDVADVVWPLVPHAVQVAVLATNIIAVNNLRDRHTDVLANKRTLAVRFGATFCRVEYGVNLAVAYGLVLWKAVLAYGNDNDNDNGNSVWWCWWWWLLPLLSSPLAWKEWRALYRKEGGALNPHVGGAAKVQLLFCILLAISARKGSPR
eukprot:CAMPEP_0172408262 /NCGR_PEP_ID=MMETSP1061-20121228/75763_1 /TAXON_ID=37318 /ORGANISM="Pseudo-nitzschia pungens, Strain cf. pungens" /LENGTH=408 /DNA_ID=CAMNT_0013144385 /DNA_START=307 /DNA_END=1533 /DNA_ORIENTATION=+